MYCGKLNKPLFYVSYPFKQALPKYTGEWFFSSFFKIGEWNCTRAQLIWWGRFKRNFERSRTSTTANIAKTITRKLSKCGIKCLHYAQCTVECTCTITIDICCHGNIVHTVNIPKCTHIYWIAALSCCCSCMIHLWASNTHNTYVLSIMAKRNIGRSTSHAACYHSFYGFLLVIVIIAW